MYHKTFEYRQAKKFIDAMNQLANRGIEDNAPIVLQPMALLLLAALADNANELLVAVTKGEEIDSLCSLQVCVTKIAKAQCEIEKQDESKPAHG